MQELPTHLSALNVPMALTAVEGQHFVRRVQQIISLTMELSSASLVFHPSTQVSLVFVSTR